MWIRPGRFKNNANRCVFDFWGCTEQISPLHYIPSVKIDLKSHFDLKFVFLEFILMFGLYFVNCLEFWLALKRKLVAIVSGYNFSEHTTYTQLRSPGQKGRKYWKFKFLLFFFFFFNSPHPIVNFTWVRIISFEIQIIPFIIRNITFQIQNKEIIYENYIRNLQITSGNYAVMIFTANLTLCHSMQKSPLILHFLRKMSEEEIFQIKFLCESPNTRNVYS